MGWKNKTVHPSPDVKGCFSTPSGTAFSILDVTPREKAPREKGPRKKAPSMNESKAAILRHAGIRAGLLISALPEVDCLKQ